MHKNELHNNVDLQVVEDFGKEWRAFNQQELAKEDLDSAFKEYFSIFPFSLIDKNSIGFDMGCGSGRFGTKIEKRFTEKEIFKMMENAGFTDVKFSDNPPFWVVVGIKRKY